MGIEMFYELVNIEKLRRSMLYLLFMIAVLTVQEIFLSRIEIFGVRAIIYPIIPIGIALLQGGMWSLGVSLVCGVLCDCMFAETVVFYTILLPTLAFITMMAERFLISREPIAFFFCCSVGIFATGLMQMLRVFLLYSAEVSPMFEVVVVQTLFSMVFIVPMYFPIRNLCEG